MRTIFEIERARLCVELREKVQCIIIHVAALAHDGHPAGEDADEFSPEETDRISLHIEMLKTAALDLHIAVHALLREIDRREA
jgi:hypothetical protein